MMISPMSLTAGASRLNTPFYIREGCTIFMTRMPAKGLVTNYGEGGGYKMGGGHMKFYPYAKGGGRKKF